jgi:hypothetical protein
MRYLAGNLYPEAKRIRLVVDNLNTHSPAAFYYKSPSSENRLICRYFENLGNL